VFPSLHLEPELHVSLKLMTGILMGLGGGAVGLGVGIGLRIGAFAAGALQGGRLLWDSGLLEYMLEEDNVWKGKCCSSSI
jgi:hypothetical protein